jgi:hypothetical protein
MPIEIIINRDKDRTTHISTGNITFDEAMAASKEFFDDHPTKDLLMDMSCGSMHLITSEQLRRLVLYFGQRSSQRPENRRTALVVSALVDYGLSRMMQTFVEIDSISTRFEIFNDIDAAVAWLDSPGDGLAGNQK